MEWLEIERVVNRSRIQAFDSFQLGRCASIHGDGIILRLAEAESLIAELCPPRNSGSLLVRHLLRSIGLDERRIFQHRFDHKLVQAVTLNHYCPKVYPRTFGAYRYFAGSTRSERGEKLDQLYASGFFVKSALGEASGEVRGIDKRSALEAFLEQHQGALRVDDLPDEDFIIQQWLSIASEFRVHSIEGFAIPRLTHDRYTPEQRQPELERKATFFVQSVLDKLPAGLVRDTLFGWDVACDAAGSFSVVEVNSTGIHPIFKPGFQCSGFFQTEAWKIPSLAKLISFVRRQYGASIVVEPPGDLDNDFSSTYWLVAQYDRYRELLDGVNSPQVGSRVPNTSPLSKPSNRLSAGENTLLWMISDLARSVSESKGLQIDEPAAKESLRELEREKAFYSELLSDVVDPTCVFARLPGKPTTPEMTESSGLLGSQSVAFLRSKADVLAVNPRTLLCLAWVRVLASISGNNDVVFLLATRRREGHSEAAPAVVLLPSRVNISSKVIRDLIYELDQQHGAIESFCTIDAWTASACSGLGRGAELTNAVFSCFLTDSDRKSPNFKVSEASGISQSIVVEIDAQADDWRMRVQSWTGLDAALLCNYLQSAVSSLVDILHMNQNPYASDIAIVPAWERVLLRAWNSTDQAFGSRTHIDQLIENQAALTPSAIAVEFDGEMLSYKDLNQRSEELAALLEDEQIKEGESVGVCCLRCTGLVIALLAILKRGAVYVPLDPSLPRDRLTYIVNDSKIRFVLAGQSGTNAIEELESKPKYLKLDHKTWSRTDTPATRTQEIKRSPPSPAYIMYTSGSTGTPKGVIVPHNGLVNRITWMQKTYPLTASDVVLHKTPFGFDVSMWELLWPLSAGARLLIAAPQLHMSPQYLVDEIITRNVTVIHFVPQMLQVVLDYERVSECVSLKRIFCSGETLGSFTAMACLKRLPGAELHNLYGPTEASIDVTAWQCHGSSDLTSVPIGSPIANTQIYILDTNLQFVPIGIAGELYIAGVGLSSGYVNRPALTASAFVSHLHSEHPGSRMYRTGDLGRWQLDGSIEFLGRNDRQVKIRGNRVELGEIEARLREMPIVADVVVTSSQDSEGDSYIIVYYVPAHDVSAADPEEAVANSLAEHLKSHLPAFMQPRSYVRLDSIPLKSNGKVDHRALSIPPKQTVLESETALTETERSILRIWRGLLPGMKIDIASPFITLGADSLKAVRCVNAMRTKFSVEVPLAWLFSREASIRELASVIDEFDRSTSRK